jgi:hypothetical protein
MRRSGFPLLFIFVVLLVCFFAVALTPRAQSPTTPNGTVVRPLVLYDDFSGPRIDPTKWNDWMASGSMREAVRELSPSYQGEGNKRRLHVFQRAYSETFNDLDASYGWLGLQFSNPTPITEVSFKIAVNSATVSECQSNPSVGSSVWAGFGGRFFSTDGSPDGSNDVNAGVELFRDSTNTGAMLGVRAVIGAPGYYDSRTLGFVSLGQTAKLHAKWDQPNHQFIFQLNGDPVVSMAYSLIDTYPPGISLKVLSVTRGIPNCTTSPLGSAMMDAYFDSVYVNAH